jgi:hypothetical protein
MDDVMLRFTNKFGKRYTPESLRTYRSRFESSVADFSSYCANPVGFRPIGRQRSAPQSNDKSEESISKRPVVRRRPNSNHRQVADVKPEAARTTPTSVVPIQIRENLIVSVGPIPFDFTEAEAKRVANVILALATIR